MFLSKDQRDLTSKIHGMRHASKKGFKIPFSGGRFKHFLVSPLPGEMIQFD